MYLIDVQGTLIDDAKREPIDGATEFLSGVKKSGAPFALITNNTKYPSLEFSGRLKGFGFDFTDKNYLDPLMCLKDYVKDGTIYAIGSENFVKTLRDSGYPFSENPDFLVISLKDDLDYEDLATAVEKIHSGAKLIGMHANAVYAKNGRKYPGLGAIVKMLEFATSTHATIIGKPSRTFYEKAMSMLGSKDPKEITVISDDPIGDLIGAKEIGMKTVLVLSGKYEKAKQIIPFLKPEERPDMIFNSVAEISIGEKW